MKRIFIKLLCVLIMLLLLASCTSSSKGSMFMDTYRSDRKNKTANKDNQIRNTPQPTEQEEEEEEEEPEEVVEELYISTDPAGADIYLNHSYKGKSPLSLTGLNPGTYKITAIKEGYYDATIWIEYSGGSKEYSIGLEEITGYLAVLTDVTSARITVNGLTYYTSPMELRIGNYTLHIRAFGYEEYTESITIYEKQTTTVNVRMQEAAFALSNLNLSRPILNPDNPGLLGTCFITFQVTSFGEGVLKIVDEDDVECFSYTFPGFKTWDQTFQWNGTGNNNRRLEDGAYRVIIEGTGKRDEEKAIIEETVYIDRSYIISFRIPWSGVSGLIYTATPDVLPPLSFQVSTHALLATGTDAAGNILFRAPLNSGLRIGLPGKAELTFSFSPVIIDSEIIPFTVTGAWKQQLFAAGSSRSFKGALAARGTFVYATNADTYTNYSGITFSIPFSFNSGIVSIIIDPEFTVSPYRVLYGTSEAQIASLQMWMYGKAGIVVDAGTIIAAVSGSVRSQSFMDGLDINYPVNAALELHILIPGTGSYFSLGTAMEFINTANYYINYGIGLSLLH